MGSISWTSNNNRSNSWNIQKCCRDQYYSTTTTTDLWSISSLVSFVTLKLIDMNWLLKSRLDGNPPHSCTSASWRSVRRSSEWFYSWSRRRTRYWRGHTWWGRGRSRRCRREQVSLSTTRTGSGTKTFSKKDSVWQSVDIKGKIWYSLNKNISFEEAFK